VIICGREINAQVLERIKTAALELSPRKLAARLCEWLDWKGPGGRFQVSVAVGVLGRLRAQGLIELPCTQTPLSAAGRIPRRPEAEPAPEPPGVKAASLAEVGPVSLVVVGNRLSDNYRIWRRLLDQHHYLRSGPLAGHQLRYLVQGAPGWLGAMAFSAAALRVGCRDDWIGWSSEARRENLPWVINNSRFLILPEAQVNGLASQVLGLALGQVAQDWEAAYGYRPVLAETFVDLERNRGTCYQAANWKLIGATQGRGRQDREHRAQLSKKLVFVYPLEQDCRVRLCAEPAVRRLAPPPRPVEVAPAPPADWAEEELGRADLGDRRLDRRLLAIARDFFARPTLSIPQACGNPGKTKAVYRFFDHARVNLQSVLQGHYAATAARARQEPLILAVQDTTELNYSAHPKTELLGPICDRQGMIGMLVHDTMAYNAQGTALGLVDVQCWTRDPELPKKAQQRHELDIERKESSKWLVSWRAAVRLQAQCPQSTVISVGDREADIYELLVEAQKEPKAKLLVRATQERKVASENPELTGLWQFMARQPVKGKLTLELPRTPKRSARTAELEVRFAKVELQAPQRKPHLGAVPVWAVHVVEIGAPPGVEPLEWKLLTTAEVASLEQALEVIRWYTLRFQIEVFHRTLKSGCRIEDRQLGNAQRIESCLAVDMVVAWRIVHLTKLGREVPEVPCTVFFEEAQWKALCVFATGNPQPPEHPPTLREVVRLMATQLGGFMGRKGDGEPGTETIWKGLQRLDDITKMWVLMSQGLVWQSPTDRELNTS
jgi:hypothetical protein